MPHTQRGAGGSDACLRARRGACGGDDEQTDEASAIEATQAPEGSITVVLEEQDGSGITGTAILSETEDGVHAVVELVGIPEDLQSLISDLEPNRCGEEPSDPIAGIYHIGGISGIDQVEARIESMVTALIALSEVQTGEWSVVVAPLGLEAPIVACGNIPAG